MAQDFFDALPQRKHLWQRRRIAKYFDALFDLRIAFKMAALRSKAKQLPARNVLLAAVEVPGREKDLRGVLSALSDSHHSVSTCVAPMGERGKFDNITEALKPHDLGSIDWLIVTDDDILVAPNFLDDFIFIAETMRLRVAQPAHRCRSYASYTFSQRKWNSLGRITRFVECGPVTAFHRDILPYILPFPSLRWAWGIDISWSVIAERQEMAIGIVDATSIEHLKRVGSTYSFAPAIAEARDFLALNGCERRSEDLFVDVRIVRNL